MNKINISLKSSCPSYGVMILKEYLPKISISYDVNQDVDALLCTTQGPLQILKHLARSFPEIKLYGQDAVEASQIDSWLDFVTDSLSTLDYKSLKVAFEKLEKHLSLRSFLIGYDLSLADIAVWGALNGNAIFKKQVKNSQDVHTSRWFYHLSSLETFKTALASFESAKESVKNKKDQGKMDINLKDAKQGQVVTRFPPEPSGYLHIGHAKAALLNDYFAKLYNGKLLVRFDDTNPSKEKMEYEDSIKEDLKLLGIQADSYSHTSDHFHLIYDYAIKMIEMGKAYVDDTDQETMRAQRFDGIESKSRGLSVQDNLARFQEMKNATEFGQKCCLRAKIDMSDKNKAMRDPVIYRCNLIPHPHTGTQWKMYPTYDFVCPIVDSLEGVTHALRTNEYRDRNPQYEWFLKTLNLRWVHIWDYSRLNFVYTLLSKRKLTWFVEQGLVTGWDDPRFATVRGIRRRGLTIEALRTYIIMQGASQRELSLEWDKLWNINKKVIDPISPRHTALAKDKLVKVTIQDPISPSQKSLPKHKKNPDVGEKTTTYSQNIYIEFEDAKELELNEEITLMDWGNAFVKSIQWNSNKTEIESVQLALHLQGDFKKTKKKLTWLSWAPTSNSDTDLVDLVLLDYDYLITKKKLEEEDELKDYITPVTEFKVEAVGDGNLRFLKKGDVIQLERKGYYICDEPLLPGKAMHLIYIPDGKVASLSSKAETATSKEPVSTKSSTKSTKTGKQGQVKKDQSQGMYSVNPIYGGSQPIDPNKISKMYLVKNIYGDLENIPPPSFNTSKATKEVKEEKDTGKPKKQPQSQPQTTQESSLVSKLDIVVGKIVSVKRHPDADSLYVEEIECGEECPRQVVSGLVKFMTPEEMQDKLVLILKNLKPASMRGIKSYAMVLCASNETHDKVEFLIPPPGSVPGDRVFFKGHEGVPEPLLNPKKKVWETVQPDFTTRQHDLVALYKEIEWQTEKGFIKTASLPKASIK